MYVSILFYSDIKLMMRKDTKDGLTPSGRKRFQKTQPRNI